MRNNCSIGLVQSSRSELILNTSSCVKEETELEIVVSFVIYVIGFMSFISWILFCFFGGIGIPSMPFDLFYDFCTRPKKRTLEEMTDYKARIMTTTKKIKSLALDIKQMEVEGLNKKFCKCICLL